MYQKKDSNDERAKYAVERSKHSGALALLMERVKQNAVVALRPYGSACITELIE